MQKNIAIYIDYDNVYLNLENFYEKPTDIDIKTDIVYKIKEKYKQDKIITCKAFADFEKIKGVLTKLQKSQIELRHVYSNGTGRKNASDIALTIDVIKSLYSKQSVDQYVIVSSDSDMLPIINELNYFGKDVHVIYSDYGSLQGYKDYVGEDKCFTIESLLTRSTYKEITKEAILENQNLNNILNIINNIINTLCSKHNGKGTSSIKDIRTGLWKEGNYVYNDVDEIIKIFMNKNYLFEYYNKKDPKYTKVAIDESVIIKDKIELENKISDFSKIFGADFVKKN